MKCKFCGIENDQVIKDFNGEQVCNSIDKCNRRMTENVKILARKLSEKTTEIFHENHKGEFCRKTKGVTFCQEDSGCENCEKNKNNEVQN